MYIRDEIMIYLCIDNLKNGGYSSDTSVPPGAETPSLDSAKLYETKILQSKLWILADLLFSVSKCKKDIESFGMIVVQSLLFSSAVGYR